MGGLEVEDEKWDKERLKKAMEEGKEEFIELTVKLNDLIVDFCMRALKVAEASKGEPLNPVQVEQMISYEIGAVLNQVSDPQFMDLVIRKAQLKYAERLGESE